MTGIAVSALLDRARRADAPPIRLDGPDVVVTGVSLDSRQVTAGDLFCALEGERHDGARFVPDAIRAGAAAVLAVARGDWNAPTLLSDEPRRAMAHLAAAFHEHPADALDLIGVTGTNGKTTVVHLLQSICRTVGRRVETIGTLTGELTTPEAPELQRLLRRAVDRHTSVVAMEVSSHALAQHRVDGIRFRVGAFTNLTRDHLDFHKTMEKYFRSKARLFATDRVDVAVIDVDTPHGRLLADTVDVPVVEVSLTSVPHRTNDAGSSSLAWHGQAIDLPLGGDFNVANAVVAAECAAAIGIAEAEIARGLAVADPVPGRFMPVATDLDAQVIVDYAHTPDGLEKVLEAARALTAGRVIVVFGCGGDRDPSKRPAMGRVAKEGADVVVVTSDNPRDESPERIIAEIVEGMEPPSPHVDVDRRGAIAHALELSEAGDLLVVAGKGHETTQTIRGRQSDFDDAVVVAEEAARIARSRNAGGGAG